MKNQNQQNDDQVIHNEVENPNFEGIGEENNIESETTPLIYRSQKSNIDKNPQSEQVNEDTNLNKLSKIENTSNSTEDQGNKTEQNEKTTKIEAIEKQRLCRLIFFGLCYLPFIIGAILLMVYHSFTLHPTSVGSWKTSQNLNFNLNISNCLVHIRDIDSYDRSTNVIKLQRPHPWPPFQNFIFEGGTDEDGTVALNLVNPYISKYCNLTLFINPAETIGNFALNCSSCVMIQDTPIFNVGGTTTINGLAVSANLAYLNSNSFSFLANQGFLQVNMINTYSDDDNNIVFTQKGDIILQSDSTINIKNFTSPSATCCFAGQTPLNIQSTPCDEANPNAQGGSCGNGRVFDSAKTDGANQKFNLYTKQGNIYCNVIPGIQQPISPTVSTTNNTEYLFFSPSYTGIDFDNSTKNQLSIFDDLVMNPTINAPILAMNLGDARSLSSTWSKWILASNSTYEYIKPWLLASISVALLEGYPYEINGQLLPGFCPWRPTLSAGDYFNIIGLLDTYKISMGVSGDVSFVYNSILDADSSELENYTNSSGVYTQINNWIPWGDKWYTLKKTDTGNIGSINHDIYDNKMTLFAFILSIICAIICGIIIFILMIDMINKYTYIIASNGSKQAAYIKIIRDKKDKNDKSVKNDNNDSNEEKDKKDANLEAPPNNSINPIPKLFYLKDNCICISTLIDYLVVYISRKWNNSIDSFFNLIFATSKDKIKNDKEEIINFENFQNYYQQYCFLNHLTEESLDQKSIEKPLKEKGFTTDGTTIFCGIILKDKRDIDMIMVGDESDSLSEFIKHCVEQTKFMQDKVEENEFIQRYTEFCKSYKLTRIVLNPKTLKVCFDIETSIVPNYIIKKIRGTEEQKNFIIDQKNLKNHLQYILGKTESLEPQKIKEIKEYLCSQETIWWMLLTGLFQLFLLLILIAPIILWFILISTGYSPYSMKNAFYLLDWKSFYYQPIVAFTHIPYVIQGFLIFIIICNGLDLIFYTMIWERPIELYFKNPKWSDNTIGKTIAFGNWIIIFILIFIYIFFLALAIIWILLGIIINPTYMLPYATTIVTFITFGIAKFKQFNRDIENTKNSILKIIESQFGIDFHKIIVSMGKTLIHKENKALGEAKDIVKKKDFKDITDKLIDQDILSKNDVDSILKKVQDLSTHNSTKDEFQICDDFDNHYELLNKEFTKLGDALHKNYTSKIEKDLRNKECPEKLVKLFINHTTKKTDNLKSEIFDFISSEDSQVSAPMKSFIGEVLSSSHSIVREENIKSLAIRLVHSILIKLNHCEETNLQISNLLVYAYYTTRAFEKKEWNKFLDNMILILKTNEKFNNYLAKNNMKLLVSSLKVISVFINKNCSIKEVTQNFNDFLSTLKSNQNNQITLEKHIYEIDEDNLDPSQNKDPELSENEYIQIHFSLVCDCLRNLVFLLKNKEFIWNHPKNTIASIDEIYNFCHESILIIPTKSDLKKYTKNSTSTPFCRIIPDFVQTMSKPKEKFAGVTNISLGLLRNDLSNIHPKSIMSLIDLYRSKSDKQNVIVSDNYVRFLFDLYFLSLENPEQFVEQAFDYSKDSVNDEWKEFILYSLTFKYTTIIAPSKILNDNKYLNIFLKKIGLTYSHFLGILYSMTDQIHFSDTNFFVDLIIEKLSISKLNNEVRHFLRNFIRLLVTQKQEIALKCIRKLKLPFKRFIMAGKGILSLDYIKNKDYEKLIKFCLEVDVVNNELLGVFKSIPKTSLHTWKQNLITLLKENAKPNKYEKIYLVKSLLHMEPNNQDGISSLWNAILSLRKDQNVSQSPKDSNKVDSLNIATLKKLKNDSHVMNNFLFVISLKEWIIKKGESPKSVDKKMIQAINQFSELLKISSNSLLNAFQLFLIDDKTYHQTSLVYFFKKINSEDQEFVEYAYKKIENVKNYSTALLISLPNVLKWKHKANGKEFDIEVPASLCKLIKFNKNTHFELAEVQESFEFISKITKNSNKMEESKQYEIYQEIYTLSKLSKGLNSSQKELNESKSICEKFTKVLTNLLITCTSQKSLFLLKLCLMLDKNKDIYLCLIIYGLLKGGGRNLQIENETFCSLAQKKFSIKAEFFDIFEAIFKTDMPSYVESCSRIIDQLDPNYDKKFTISMLSFLNNQYADLSLIAKKLGYSSEILEFITTLCRIKNKIYRSNALSLMESSVSIQNTFKDIDIDPNEFSSILRIIFNEINDKFTFKQVLKVLDPKKFVDFSFAFGVHILFQNASYSGETMENLRMSSKKVNENRMKLDPLFKILDLDPIITFIMISLKKGDFLILEAQVKELQWIFGKVNTDNQEEITPLSDAGLGLLHLTEGLAGIVNINLELLDLPENSTRETNSLNYAQSLFSKVLNIDRDWLEYGISISNPDKPLLDRSKDGKNDKLLMICLLYNAMEIISVKKDVLGLNDWHGNMIYNYNYKIRNEFDDQTYLNILDNANDALKTLTIELLDTSNCKKIINSQILKNILKDEYPENAFNREITNSIAKILIKIKELSIFKKFVENKYEPDSKTLGELGEFLRDKAESTSPGESKTDKTKSNSPAEFFQKLDDKFRKNRIYSLLIKCLIPYIYEMMWGKKNKDEALKENNTAFLDIAIISGIMEIRNINFNQKEYTYNLFSLNILMTNIERKLIFIDYEMTKLYRKFAIMKLIGLSSGIIIPNAFEMFLSPPVINIWILNKYRFFDYKKTQSKSQKEIDSKEAENFLKEYNINETNYTSNPKKLIHDGNFCNYCSLKSNDRKYNAAIKGIRYVCKDEENCGVFDLCEECKNELDKIPIENAELSPEKKKNCYYTKIVAHKSHEVYAINASIDKISKNHIIRTYYEETALHVAYIYFYPDQLYGRVLVKNSWNEVWVSKLKFDKLAIFDPPIFATNIEYLKDRLKELEKFVSYFGPSEKFSQKESEHTQNCFPILVKRLKDDEGILLYPSFDIAWQKIMQKFEILRNEATLIKDKIEQSHDSNQEDRDFDEKHNDLRTNIKYSILESKIKDFELTMMNPNAIMLINLYDNKFDFENARGKNYLTDRNKESLKTHQLIINLHQFNMNNNLNSSNYPLNIQDNNLASDQRSLNQLIGFLISNQDMDSANLECLKRSFNINQQNLNYLTICNDYIAFREENIKYQSRNQELKENKNKKISKLSKMERQKTDNETKNRDNETKNRDNETKKRDNETKKTDDETKKTDDEIKKKNDEIKKINDEIKKIDDEINDEIKKINDKIKTIEDDRREKINNFLEKMGANKETIEMIISLDFIYNLNLNSWKNLAKQLISKNNNPNVENDNPEVEKLMNIISYINFKAFDKYLHKENTNETNDWTNIPNIINDSSSCTNVKTDLLKFILKQYRSKELNEDEKFVCTILNRILECYPGEIDDNLLDSFINISKNQGDLGNNLTNNYLNLINSLLPIEITDSNLNTTKNEIKRFFWLLYLKKTNFKNLEEKQKYADIIFKLGKNKKDEDTYFLAFLGYIKCDFELILDCVDHETEYFAILSSLYLLLNWDQILNYIYLSYENGEKKNKINPKKEESKHFLRSNTIKLNNEIAPLIDYFSIIFAFSFTILNNGPDPLSDEYVISCLENMKKNVSRVQKYMEKIEIDRSQNQEQYKKNINKNINKLRTNIIQLQFNEKSHRIFGLDQDKQENDDQNKQENDDQNKGVIKLKFTNMVKKLYSLQDFFLLNFDALITDDFLKKYDWIFLNYYLILVEHYNKALHFSSKLKVKEDETTDSGVMISDVKNNIIFLMDLTRNCCNLFNEHQENNFKIMSDIMKLILDNLYPDASNHDKNNFKNLRTNILKLFSITSGYNFVDFFKNYTALYDCNHEQECLSSQLPKIISKFTDNGNITEMVPSLNLQKEWLNNLIPLLVGLEHNPTNDTWSISQIDAFVQSSQKSKKAVTRRNTENIKGINKNDDNNHGHQNLDTSNIENEITFSQYKEFYNQIIKLMKILTTKFKQSIYNNSTIPDILKDIFDTLESIFSELQVSSQNLNTMPTFTKVKFKSMSKEMNKLGKLVIALYKLNFGDIDSFEALLTYKLNEKEKVKNIMDYMKETSSLVSIHKFKKITKIHATQRRSLPLENIKNLTSKIKSGKITEQDLFRLCDSLGDGSGGISMNEFGTLARRMGIPLTEHRLQEIFAEIKGHKILSDKELDLDFDEFARALLYLKEQQVLKALEFIGITKERLYSILALLLLILFCLFLFIFLGIQAFAVGGGFSAIVNSFLPVLAALGLNTHKIDNKKESEKDLKEACKKSKAVITKTHHEH